MMKTRKQIVEQTRNEVAKQYTAKLQILMERINKLTKDYDIEKQKRIECQERIDELQEKVNQYEDWIQRLQEFVDIPENQKEEYIVHMKAQEDANKIMLQIINLYNFME
mgnify:CR=1 FL=1